MDKNRKTGIGWFPWAVLSLLGLVGLFAFGLSQFAESDIESTAVSRIHESLRQAGFGSLSTKGDGQTVYLSGVVGSDGDGDKALAIARDTTCDTWTGRRVCARTVVGNFDSEEVAPSVPWPDFRANLGDKQWVLTGVFANTEAQQKIVAAAKAAAEQHKVAFIDRSSVLDGNPRVNAGYSDAVDRGVAALEQCFVGKVSLIGQQFSAKCEVAQASLPGLRAELSSPLTTGTVGEVALIAKESLTACDEEFRQVLSANKIQFATGSAALLANSQPTIDKIVAIAKRCQGQLRVEGHTDNVGRGQANLLLSEQRAQAVATALTEQGVDEKRLQVSGYGDTKPRATNDTSSGRAQNRRIEFTTVGYQ